MSHFLSSETQHRCGIVYAREVTVLRCKNVVLSAGGLKFWYACAREVSTDRNEIGIKESPDNVISGQRRPLAVGMKNACISETVHDRVYGVVKLDIYLSRPLKVK
jgi:hypothetical protein